MKIIITSPSLNTDQNVSGISSVTKFITQNNPAVEYIHFELGRRDNDVRDIYWLLRNIKMYFKWIFYLTIRKGEMVHFNFAVDKFGLLRDLPLIVFAKITGKRIILHLHGGEYLLDKNAPRWIRFLLKIALWGNPPAIVLSTKEAGVLEEKYKCKKLFVLPNCIDLKDAKLFQRKNDDGILKLLFMGRISTKKGIEYILTALQNLRQQGYLFEFYLAGKGPDEMEYIQKFESILGTAFIFKGVVSGESKSDLLKYCNVFLLPSFFEGLPIALLESMAYGLVPVVTPVGSINDLIEDGENGLIVNIRSAEDIENAIKKLIENFGLRQVLSNNARAYIFKNYDPGQYINTLNSIYRNE